MAGSWILLFAVAGCISPSMDGLGPGQGDREGYAPLELSLKTIGKAPQNVTALNMSLASVAFMQEESGEWVRIDVPVQISLDLQGTGQGHGSGKGQGQHRAISQWSLPVGEYEEARVTLETIEITLNGEEQRLELTDDSCQIPVSFDLKSDEGPTRLTLFLWLEDALVHTEQGLQGKPAFGGSYSSKGEGPDEGSPRMGDVRCVS